LSSPKENSRFPVLAIFITIQVLLSSPANKQPAFPDPGFVLGFEIPFPASSNTFPAPLGFIENVALVHIFTASTQSLAEFA
jgi:hypothetical protein